LLVAILIAIIFILLATTIFFWKLGVVKDSEHPEPVIDRPVMDPKERRAITKRLKRWHEEGKLTRAEFEHVSALCDSEWDGSD
jgi:hypothetical protein